MEIINPTIPISKGQVECQNFSLVRSECVELASARRHENWVIGIQQSDIMRLIDLDLQSREGLPGAEFLLCHSPEFSSKWENS